MKNTIKRDEAHFNRSVMRLYNAYVNGELNPMDCGQCAVGNMLNNKRDWKSTIFALKLGIKPDKYFEDLLINCNLNYTYSEIMNIESLYMRGSKLYEIRDDEMADSCELKENRPDHLNLKGLLLVVDYLGELHGIETPDIKELFTNKELDLTLV